MLILHGRKKALVTTHGGPAREQDDEVFEPTNFNSFAGNTSTTGRITAAALPVILVSRIYYCPVLYNLPFQSDRHLGAKMQCWWMRAFAALSTVPRSLCEGVRPDLVKWKRQRQFSPYDFYCLSTWSTAEMGEIANQWLLLQPTRSMRFQNHYLFLENHLKLKWHSSRWKVRSALTGLQY